MTGMNNALSYTLDNAITGVYPSFEIDYAVALVSRGGLPNVLGPAVTSGAGSVLTFSWTDNSGVGIAKATDQAILVAYCPELRQAIYTTARWIAKRSYGRARCVAFQRPCCRNLDRIYFRKRQHRCHQHFYR